MRSPRRVGVIIAARRLFVDSISVRPRCCGVTVRGARRNGLSRIVKTASARIDIMRPPETFLHVLMSEAPSTRREELRSFLFFTVVMAPLLAVVIVGGYGFLVWMYYLVAGPPQA